MTDMGAPGGGDKNFKKAVAEVATVELFCFYVIVKIIMHIHLSMDVCSHFYLSSKA